MAELSPKQQVVEALRNNKNFLILTHKNPDGDAIGSSLALYQTLKRLGKDAVIVCADETAAAFGFLSDISEIRKDCNSFRDFVISLDTNAVKADKVMYKVEGNKLQIIITPKNGEFTKESIAFPRGSYNFDTIIVLDCTDTDRLGNIYETNSDLFYEIPVVNIDHHAGNSNFGKINLIDLTSTSTAEILVSIIESLTGDPKFFDEKIATSLLTGIITDTNSFQNTNTTPKALTVAAQLVALGARQQEIIKNIYKTKQLSTLRLWGRALVNLKEEQEQGFVWSKIYKKDYQEVGASEDESAGLIDELLKTASGVDFALLLTEKNGDLHGSLRSSNRTTDVRKIAELFNGGGHVMASAFQLKGKSFDASGEEVIRKIKNYRKDLESKLKDTGSITG